MGTLIAFEIKNFISKKKNLAVMCIFIAFLIFVITLCIYGEQLALKRELEIEKENLVSINKGLQNLENIKDSKMPAYILTNQIELVRLKNVIVESIENGNWQQRLSAQVQFDKITLDQVKKSNLVGPDLSELEKDIAINQILLEKNIKPININFSMESYNFIRLIFNDFMPILMILVIVLLSSDSLSGEADKGTFKFLLLQPFSRAKIIYSKLIAQILICLVFFTTVY